MINNKANVNLHLHAIEKIRLVSLAVESLSK